jgi:D-alanyl-lipoteichoic acid acyltransferase DltB (MBOAT superfamily)
VTFDLAAIALLTAGALIYSLVLPRSARAWALFTLSVIAVYAFQPALPIRFSDYVLPGVTLGLVVVCWWATRQPSQGEEGVYSPALRRWLPDLAALLVIIGVMLGLTAFRYLGEDARMAARLVASRPPDAGHVLIVLIGAGALLSVGALITRTTAAQRRLGGLMALLVIAIFVVFKSEPLAGELSRLWRSATGQDTSIARAFDLNWLGFSYVAFRLLHTLRDRQTGILPALSLREYVTYVVFFPALTAGPIDRAERFADDLRTLPQKHGPDAARWLDGLTRISLGLLKKFVIADSLAQGAALTPALAEVTTSTPALWLLLYGYALRLYFDFSGYTDIAIGIGILFGIRLPENFNRPYLKNTITSFWQSWHMTLSAWARSYVFSPLSRWLMMRPRKPSQHVIVLSAHLATMMLIGAWHGVTLNFVIWGIWHGLALFAHKLWSDRTRSVYRALTPGRRRAWTVFGWALTFHWVVLGWVWFALPTPEAALRTFAGLFGLAG